MQRILVYGTSIFLAGLSAQLQSLPDVQLRCRDTLTDLGELTAIDAVLVDFNDPLSADVLTMLRARPDLKVVGVNATSNAVTMLSGQVYLAQTVDEAGRCLTHTLEKNSS